MDELRLNSVGNAAAHESAVGFMARDDDGREVFVSFKLADARAAVTALLHAICRTADEGRASDSYWRNDGASFQPIPELEAGLLTLKVPSELRVVLSLTDAQTLAFRMLEPAGDRN